MGCSYFLPGARWFSSNQAVGLRSNLFPPIELPVSSLNPPFIEFSPWLNSYTGWMASNETVRVEINSLGGKVPIINNTFNIYSINNASPTVLGNRVFFLAIDTTVSLRPGLVTGVQSEQLGVFDPATLVQTGAVETTFTLDESHPLRILSIGKRLPPPYTDTVTYEFDLEVTDGLFEATGETTMTVTADVPFGQNTVTLTGYGLSEYTGSVTEGSVPINITHIRANPTATDAPPIRSYQFDTADPEEIFVTSETLNGLRVGTGSPCHALLNGCNTLLKP